MRRHSGKLKWVCLGVVFCLFLLLILAGCTTSGNQGTAGKGTNDPSNTGPALGGTLKMIMLEDTSNLGYPPEQRSTGQLYLSQPAIETLGRFDQSGKITPWLAESWQSNPKENTITFKLKEGIKFQDGTDFNAEAVKWNIEQFQAAKRPEVGGIQSVHAIDAKTVRLTLGEWDSTVLESVAYYVGMISPTAVQKNGKEWSIKNPVGTGPFKLVSWEPKVSTKFKKNENYWQKGKPYLDGIEYVAISERNTALNAFKTGSGDVLTQLDAEWREGLEKSDKFVTKTFTSENTYGNLGLAIMFDSGNPDSPFAKLKVRQAVIHAVDKNAIINSLYKGFGVPLNQWNTSNTWSYNPDVKGFAYDPEKAKQLLAEAGYPDGFKTTLTTVSPGPSVLLMTAVQNYLSKIGIEVKLVNVDNAKWAALVSSKWDGMINAPMSLNPSTLVVMNRMFGKNGLYSKNIFHPEKVEQLIADARSAPDYDSYKKSVQYLQKEVYEENVLAFPVFSFNGAISMDKKVQNLQMRAINGFDWNPEDVWMKK